MDNTERQRLEQGSVPLLRDRQPLGQHLKPAPVSDMLGDVVGEQEQPESVISQIRHRLVEEVDEQRIGIRAVLADQDRGLAALSWLTAAGRQLQRLQAIAIQLRHRLAQWQAGKITPAEDSPVLLVGELDYQLGSAHIRHARRHAHQQLAHQRWPVERVPWTRLRLGSHHPHDDLVTPACQCRSYFLNMPLSFSPAC